MSAPGMLASKMLSRFQASVSEEFKQFNWLIKACSRPILKERKYLKGKKHNIDEFFPGTVSSPGKENRQGLKAYACLERMPVCLLKLKLRGNLTGEEEKRN